MMKVGADFTEVTESTHVPDGRDTQAFAGFSVLEEAMESDSDIESCSLACSRDSVYSSIPPARKSYASTEEVQAIQTCTNSLRFKTRFEEESRPRSASFSLPRNRENENESTVLWKFNFGRRGGRWFPRTHKMSLQEYNQVEEEERVWNFSKTRRVVRTEEVPKELRTAVMLRCIPREYTRDDILRLLHEHDFGEINFLYLLMNVKTGENAGYCFINFRFPHDARAFKSSFTGHRFSDADEEEAIVAWRHPIQGFASHFDQFKSSTATHAHVPPSFRPTLIRDGKVVEFPEMWDTVRSHRACRKIKKQMGKLVTCGVSASISGVRDV